MLRGVFFFFEQKSAYEMRISDWSSDVCSSDLNSWGADFYFCAGLAAEAKSVLDLGCGTGELAAGLADGRQVVGVDPAAAMLEVAQRRPGGDKVEWIEADARGVRLGRRFDLILLTGHAFQVFLTRADQAAVLRTIAQPLSPRGRFVFDTHGRAPCRERVCQYV